MSTALKIRPNSTARLARFGATLGTMLCATFIVATPMSLPFAISVGEATGHRDLAAWLPIAQLLVVITLLDYLVGIDRANRSVPAALDAWFALIPVLVFPVQCATLWWAASVYANPGWTTGLGQLGWIVSVGLVSGSMGITAAHELIHRSTRLERWAGGALLSTVAWGGFTIEHVYGHHVHVGTPLDGSTARRGETVYAFIARAFMHNPRRAWVLQRARLARQGHRVWSMQNGLLVWHGLTVLIAVGFFAAFSWSGLLFFVGQAIVAIAVLECINYIEHYGLQRRLIGHRYERVDIKHSWNSSYALTNAFLLNLQRHSDHHAAASRRYQLLRHEENSPQLPGGYGAMIALALVPPVWFAIIDPKLDARSAASRT